MSPFLTNGKCARFCCFVLLVLSLVFPDVGLARSEATARFLDAVGLPMVRTG